MTLIDKVRDVCSRLAPHGWANLMSAHGLDIRAADLGAELARPLTAINRSLPGFEDFAIEGRRGIEPRDLARSLFFHALASPNVVAGPGGDDLAAFPTLAELDIVENYVYGASAPSLPELLSETRRAKLSIVAFASEYRPSYQTPHQKHADMCYARTGVARVGTSDARYDGRRRGFLPTVAEDANQIRVLPARYSVYLAVQVPGNEASFTPMRFLVPDAQSQETGDQARMFWLPIHKLFSGPECIRGRNLNLQLRVHHVNEKLRRIHLALGADASWHEPDISAEPFRFTKGIADLTTDPDLGFGVVVPAPHSRTVEPAEFRGEPLTFQVPPNTPLSSSFNIEAEGLWRHGPEYVHVRTMVTANGDHVNLNERPDVSAVVAAGGYRALHYVDFTGDGWVEPIVPELAIAVPRRRNAYSLVTAPDFFPNTDQRELTEWVAGRVPTGLRNAIWRVPPDPLSDQRFPANLELTGAEFRADEDTVTAIVAVRRSQPGQPTRLDVPQTERNSYLPDDAAGVFAPGWDVSIDGTDGSPEHLAAYGLGSPFPEDSKLCAALSSFWPAVAPDAARTFEPSPVWPTVIPLTDEEIGSIGDNPWDGVPGPKVVVVGGQRVVEYTSLAHADYVASALGGKFTLALTAAIGEAEYESRILSMIRAYRALGVNLTGSFSDIVKQKARWTVLSFQRADLLSPLVQAAQNEAGATVLDTAYLIEMYLRGAMRPDPSSVGKILVEIVRSVQVLIDPVTVLMKDGQGTWHTMV
jgi:hypothetical protein